MRASYRYRVVDVFTKHPLEGNPLAVFPDAEGLDEFTLQRIARELNLSETAFVFPPSMEGCVARIRIFTPNKEMEFAGHPTIGSSFVLLDEGLVRSPSGRFVLQEKVGAVPIRVEEDRPLLIWLTTPPIEEGDYYDPGLCAKALGLDTRDLLDIAPQLLDAGNPTIFIGLKNREAVDRAWLDLAGSTVLRGKRREPMCVFVFSPTQEGAYSRMFAPEYGIPEDPATGSSTGPLAFFMMRHKLASGHAGCRLVNEQGTMMGRRSILHIHILGENGSQGIEVGGHVTPLVSANMTFHDKDNGPI